MIEVCGLTKRYGRHTAVDNISFTAAPGEIVGFLGPNGAGKTTTMNCVTGYTAATSGEVKICGLDILAEPEKAKVNIGYLPDTPPVYGDMRVDEYLNFAADIKKVGKGRWEMLESIKKQVSIDDVSRRLVKNLSRGYKQRLGLAQAMVGEPKVIIMDEPTIGLDPKQIIEMREVIKNLGKKYTVMFSSHIMQEVSAVCDRVMIINRGRIVASDAVSGIGSVRPKMQVIVKGEQKKVLEAIKKYTVIECVKAETGRESGTVELILTGNGSDIREIIFTCMAENNFPILMMKPAEKTLEEIFLSLTGGGDGK